MPIFVALIALGLAQNAGYAPSPWSNAPAAPLKRLSDIPGVTVSYYDVVGTTIPQLHDWLQKHGPRDSQTQKVTPTTSSWSIGSAVKFSKAGGRCRLTGTTIKFTGSVQLPRLGAGVQLPAAALFSWNAYVAALEDRQARRLGLVNDRLGEVQRAIMQSNCDNWQKAADAAITRLGAEQDEAFRLDPAKLPQLRE
jgi:predicted secreted Zn-dependent protease